MIIELNVNKSYNASARARRNSFPAKRYAHAREVFVYQIQKRV